MTILEYRSQNAPLAGPTQSQHSASNSMPADAPPSSAERSSSALDSEAGVVPELQGFDLAFGSDFEVNFRLV